MMIERCFSIMPLFTWAGECWRDGPKDLRDAVVAAVTGAEFLAGNGQEVGGGDGLGPIVFPRKLPAASDRRQVVQTWPC